MASILLSYIDSDKVAAKALARSLEDAGHTVDSADPTGPALRLGKRGNCIIVIWSPAAVVSPHIYEDARVALSLGALVQVFTGDFDPSTLPAVFRARPLFSIANEEQIRRCLIQLEQKLEILAELKRLDEEEAEFTLGVMGGSPPRGRPHELTLPLSLRLCRSE